MINITNTEPPKELEINGGKYPINYDFRVWIEVCNLLQDYIPIPETEQEHFENFDIIRRIEHLIFPDIIPSIYKEVIPEAWQLVLKEVYVFIQGYPRMDNEYRPTDEELNTKLYSFKHDINYIVLAIRNQSGIDLTYRRKEPFHYWLFLLEFETLSGQHYICDLISTRAYKGDNEEYKKHQRRVALPKEHTKAELKEIEEKNKIFEEIEKMMSKRK